MNVLPDTNSLRKHLLESAATNQLCSYKALIDALSIPSGRSMRTLTALLEACQEDDALLNRPQLAALVIQKNGKPVPRPGFFEKLIDLGLYEGSSEGMDAEMWHRNEVERVYRFYQQQKL